MGGIGPGRRHTDYGRFIAAVTSNDQSSVSRACSICWTVTAAGVSLHRRCAAAAAAGGEGRGRRLRRGPAASNSGRFEVRLSGIK